MPSQYTPRVPITDRLLAYGLRDGDCLLWTGTIRHDGYGLVNFEGRTQTVHRVAYRVFVGPIPWRLQVQHSCNIRRCFEPSHLSVGTAKRNTEYAVSLGRMASGQRNGKYTKPERTPRGDRNGTRLHPEIVTGERNPRAILTEANVREVRERAALGETHRALAQAFGVGKTTITHIVRRESWKHVQ